MTAPLESRWLNVADLPAARTFLTRDAEANLLLLDLTERLGAPPSPGEAHAEIVGAWRGEELVGMAGLRPSVVLDASARPEAVEAFVPYLESLGVGLVKSPASAVDLLWARLSQRGERRALVDRLETAYSLRADAATLRDPRPGETLRPATPRDLEHLVVAARESLREEDRPDPFAGDARGFTRWVRGRVARARVVEHEGEIVFVGYADVRRPEGWLLQGVYTFPAWRRRGCASVGVSALCREAFAACAEHVQLAVVDGNEAGERLYAALGFTPFARLRTILFT